ncbi:MAG: hypothetical protein KDC05_02365 [Bacteroidales bacterium]|nr:hypothetical protein [Bacteroidales bacterium]
MKKRNITFLLILILGILQAQTQSFEEFKKQRESDLDAFRKKQEEFIKKMQDEFDQYVEQRDKEFADYLSKQWKQYEVFAGVPIPESPKPDEIPAYDTEDEDQESWNRIEPIKTENISTDDQQQMILPRLLKSDEATFDKTNMTFGFFGFRIILDYDNQIRIDPPAAINPSTISSFWSKMSNTNYNNLVTQLEDYKTRLNLNDWAYYMLAHEFASTVYDNSETGRDLLTWVLLNRSGFKTRLAYSGNNLCLLIPSQNMIYSLNYFTENGINYYLLKDLGTQEISTYDKDYAGSGRYLDFSIKSPLNFNKKLVSKSLGFNFEGKPYSLNISYNQNLIDFYSKYPQVDLDIYFDAAVSPETKESLMGSLKPIVLEMNEQDAVNFLLRFVQSTFAYKTDQQQFNREKFFFPEEIIYYPYSDCEDRSVFFAYLVKELLNLQVIGLEYPGHVATAVNFTSESAGDYLEHNGKRFTIADPTFINAPVGLTMPEFRGVQPRIIELSTLAVNGSKAKTVWERVMESGGQKGGNLQDIVYDETGNAYLTGYFTDQVRFGEILLDAGNNGESRNVFVAKFDKNGQAVWAKKASSGKNATGFTILLENNNDLYVAGSFTGNLTFDESQINLTCKDELNDVFIAKYNVAGRLIWAGKGGLDTYPQENHLTYLTKFGKDGSNRGTSFFNEDQNFKNYGLQSGPMGLLYLTGSFSNTAGFVLAKKELVTNEGGSFDLLTSLKDESDKLIGEQYEQSIAGLFSVVNHIKYNGIKITGDIAQKTLDKYNSRFKDKYPSIYESIGKINFLLNDDGIITLETITGKSLSIDKLKISNGSKIKISSYSDGNAQIDILSGISVGKVFIWYDLNYVKLFKKSGDLLFDYDSDHTQTVLNLKEDLLY